MTIFASGFWSNQVFWWSVFCIFLRLPPYFAHIFFEGNFLINIITKWVVLSLFGFIFSDFFFDPSNLRRMFACGIDSYMLHMNNGYIIKLRQIISINLSFQQSLRPKSSSLTSQNCPYHQYRKSPQSIQYVRFW